MPSGGQWLGIGWAPWRGGVPPPPSNASLLYVATGAGVVGRVLDSSRPGARRRWPCPLAPLVWLLPSAALRRGPVRCHRVPWQSPSGLPVWWANNSRLATNRDSDSGSDSDSSDSSDDKW